MEDFVPPTFDAFWGSKMFFFVVFLVIVFNVFLIFYCIKKRKEESQD